MFVTVEVSPQQATADVISPVLVVNAQVAGSMQHNALLGLQGGVTDEYYHLSAAELANFNILVGSGDTVLHYHSADRARANHTGTQLLSTISDAGTIASQDAHSLLLQALIASDTPLAIKGVLSHSANLIEVRDSSNVLIAGLQPYGAFFSYGADGAASNTFIGGNAGLNNDVTGAGAEGLNNTAIGLSALKNNTTGQDNTAVGRNSLLSNTVGSENAVLGAWALDANTIGGRNMAFGAFALTSNIDGGTNVAIGYASLLSHTTGDSNVALGTDSLRLNQTGASNVALGNQAGYNELGSNTLYIANSNTSTPLIYGLFSGAGAGVTIYSQNAAGTPLIVQAKNGQSVPLISLKNNSGAPQLEIAANGRDFILDATTGTKIGTASSQKLALWGVTPVVQPSGTGETVGFAAGSGTGVNDDSTFTGNFGGTAYNLNDVVKALKQIGALAA